MHRIRERIIRLVAFGALQLLICGLGYGQSAEAQQSHSAQSEELIRWTEARVEETMRSLPAGTKLPPPSAQGIANALALFSTSPLTGSGMQQPGDGSGESLPSSVPFTIQLPPHPPESQAPPIGWRPPIEAPDPSTIPSPPLSQAPPQQQRPPIQLPNPTGAAQSRPPIDLPVIPLPPHPPESQAPWNTRG